MGSGESHPIISGEGLRQTVARIRMSLIRSALIITAASMFGLTTGAVQARSQDGSFLDRLLAVETGCDVICPPVNTAIDLRTKLRHLRGELAKHIRENPEAAGRVDVLNEFIFERIGIRASQDLTDPNNLLLARVLERKQGYCVGIVSLYLALANELDLPMFAVPTPSHVFLRYDDGESRINIETFQRGAYISDEEYIRDHRIPESSVRKGVFLRNLTGEEFLSQIHNNLGVIYAKRGDYENAAGQYREARHLDPRLPAAYYNHGNDLLKQGKYRKAVRRFSKSMKLYPTDAWALNNRGLAYKELGWIQEAREDFEQALEIEPGFGAARSNLQELPGPECDAQTGAKLFWSTSSH